MDEPSQTPPVDFCNHDDPRARPPNRLNPAHPTRGRPRARLTRASPFGHRSFEPGDPPLARQTSRDFTGQGRDRNAMGPLLPWRSLAEEALPRPNPTRTPPVADPPRCRPGEPAPQCAEAPFRESAQRPLTCVSRRLRGPPLVPLREEERDTPHPRCLPSPNIPRRRSTLLSTGCPQPVDYWTCASSSPAAGGLLTGSPCRGGSAEPGWAVV